MTTTAEDIATASPSERDASQPEFAVELRRRRILNGLARSNFALPRPCRRSPGAHPLLNHKKRGSSEITYDSGFYGSLRPGVEEAIFEVSTRKPAPVT